MPKILINSQEKWPDLLTVDGAVFAALCRCGGSNKKRYCDGTHRKIAFKAASAELKVLE